MNRRTVLSIVVIVMCLFLFGCSGKHCIKVGGSYEGIQGDLEYCFDYVKSQEAQHPVYSNEKDSVVLISESNAQKINYLIEKQELKNSESVNENKESVEIKNVKPFKTEILRLLEHLRK